MASSQVEFSSSAPFGCVLRDHNQRERRTHVAFQKKLKNLVRDHLHNCISVSSNSSSVENLNTQINNPDNSSSKAEISNIGASSLVQMWENRLNHSNSMKMNTNSNSNQGLKKFIRTRSCISESNQTENTLSADERYEEAFGDWHSNRTNPNSPPSSSSQDLSSDNGESERVRVADIIRRLTAANQTQISWSEDNDNSSESPNYRDQSESRSFPQVISSPRIRGRQAFTDLLLQMERDRQRELDSLVERRAVSRFSQRGRIQSLLRLRILRRGLAVKGQEFRKSEASEANKVQQVSTIMQLRERFSTGKENGAEIKNEASTSTNPFGETRKNSVNLDGCSTSNQLTECNQHQEIDMNKQHNKHTIENSKSCLHDIRQEEACSSSQEITAEHSIASSSSISSWDDEEIEEEQEADDDDQQYMEERSYNWFSEISRPRSYWEDRRNEWYEEMLGTNSDKDDIRRLLERRTVSNFLASDFRERMDRMMMSRLERHSYQEAEAQEEDIQERHTDTQPEGSQVEEEESLISGNDYDQSASPSLLMTWSYRDNDVVDDSDRVIGSLPSPLPPLPSQSFYHDHSQQSSPSSNHASLEMEVIYNMRGQMEQLYHEMSELRKSIKSCIDMQLVLQQSMKHDRIHSVGGGEGEGKKGYDHITRKRNCCICYEMQVDSLLHRCGHMCPCIKCANELQWSSAKCPICRAPMVVVVRAYADS